MTRINSGIPPVELTDKHLLAEHREIKRIPNTIKSGRANINGIPESFTLGKGHVKFFYNKLLYLRHRYIRIREECIKRGFNITNYEEAWYFDIPKELYNDWVPTEEARLLIRQRILDRITDKTKTMKRQPVESSNILSIGYDPKKMLLEVEFGNGAVYQYHPITEQAYKELMNADSIGSWFFKNIKNNKDIKFKAMD